MVVKRPNSVRTVRVGQTLAGAEKKGLSDDQAELEPGLGLEQWQQKEVFICYKLIWKVSSILKLGLDETIDH